MARPKILVFQHVPYEPLGTLDPLLKKAGLRIRYVNFGRDPGQSPSLDGYTALIILGAFESCASAHYWARAAKRHGHEARIIPAKAVAPFRQGHKTDSNDALGRCRGRSSTEHQGSTDEDGEQQGLQAIQRSRELLIGECTALSNHLRGILLEFGVAIPQGFASLLRRCRRSSRTATTSCRTCTGHTAPHASAPS